MFFHSQKLDVIHSPNRFRITNAVHRVLCQHVIHNCGSEHGSHGDIRLTNGRPCVGRLHPVQDDLAVHGFDITQAHTANDWLNVHTVPFPVIPFGIGGQICDEICDPELKPGIHRHFGGGAVNVVLFFVLHIGKPIASFW